MLENLYQKYVIKANRILFYVYGIKDFSWCNISEIILSLRNLVHYLKEMIFSKSDMT